MPFTCDVKDIIQKNLLEFPFMQEYQGLQCIYSSKIPETNPQVQQSSHIQLVTQLEQWLMEGAYNKVLDARKTVPDESYAYFMEKLLSTVRCSSSSSSSSHMRLQRPYSWPHYKDHCQGWSKCQS